MSEELKICPNIEECPYSEIVDWEPDPEKTGKAKAVYWCERFKNPDDCKWSKGTMMWMNDGLEPDEGPIQFEVEFRTKKEGNSE